MGLESLLNNKLLLIKDLLRKFNLQWDRPSFEPKHHYWVNAWLMCGWTDLRKVKKKTMHQHFKNIKKVTKKILVEQWLFFQHNCLKIWKHTFLEGNVFSHAGHTLENGSGAIVSLPPYFFSLKDLTSTPFQCH